MNVSRIYGRIGRQFKISWAVQVSIGRSCPKGYLPVFSVDTRDEAKLLVVAVCPRDLRGNYYARELAQDQTLENLALFSDKLQAAHDRLVKTGVCRCKPLGKNPV